MWSADRLLQLRKASSIQHVARLSQPRPLRRQNTFSVDHAHAGGSKSPCPSPCSRKSVVHLAQSFSKLMFEGKVKQALRLLAAQGKGGTLNLDSHIPASGTCSGAKTGREILFEKHPKGQPIKSSIVIVDDVPSQGPHPELYERIDGPLIHSIALKTEGVAGPSGIDAAGWRRLLSSFQKDSVELCEAVASMTRRLSTIRGPIWTDCIYSM